MAQAILQLTNGCNLSNHLPCSSISITNSHRLSLLRIRIKYVRKSKDRTRPFSEKCPNYRWYPCVQALDKNTWIGSRNSSYGDYWASIDDEIEVHIKQAIPIREPLEVFEPMHHLAFTGPRSMAPALCIAACELVGGRRAQALPVASALHVMHAAVQAHHHLTLMGQAGAMHHAFGPGIELQTGDALFSLGYELLAGLDMAEPGHSARVLAATVEVARVMGSRGVVEGQYREVECSGTLDGEESCEGGWQSIVYEKKYGGLHACGAACGAIVGEGSEEEIRKLRKFGLFVGIIQGMLHGIGAQDKEVIEMVEGLRELALKELEGFNPTKIEAISSFVDVFNA